MVLYGTDFPNPNTCITTAPALYLARLPAGRTALSKPLLPEMVFWFMP